MKNTVVPLTLCVLVAVMSMPTRAMGGAIEELIGTDPYVTPATPQPTVYFSPDPGHSMPNPLPVPDPKPDGEMKMRRLQKAVLPTEGSSDTIPVEVSSFRLGGGPVDVDGSFFDVSFTLDVTKASTGSMTITRGPGPESAGTFESFFDVFLVAEFVPVPGGADSPFTLPTTLNYWMTGSWIGVEVAPGQENFVVVSPLILATDQAGGVLYLNPAAPSVPSVHPSILGLLALLLGGSAAYVLRRVRSGVRPRALGA